MVLGRLACYGSLLAGWAEELTGRLNGAAYDLIAEGERLVIQIKSDRADKYHITITACERTSQALDCLVGRACGGDS